MVRQSQTGERIGARLLVRGRVQGVGYRFFAEDVARALKLAGWVRNLPGGDVESYAEGPRPVVESYIEELRRGPSMAHVEHVSVDWQPPQNRYDSFSIISGY